MKLFFYFDDELKTKKPQEYPVKLAHFQAYIGRHEIKDLARNINHRREIARRYQEIFLKEGGDLPEGAFLRYSLLVQSPAAWRIALDRYLTVGRWFSTVAHGRTSHWDSIHYEEGSCPVAEWVADHVINFPTHFFIDEKAIKRLQILIAKHRLDNTLIPIHIDKNHAADFVHEARN